MPEARFIIIGAGPTGLGAGYRLRELGISSFQILEAQSQVGGLATSYVDEHGFTWDVGGHVLFSHYDYFDRLMDRAIGPQGWLHHQRDSAIWVRNRFIPYPFQNNIHYLPPAEVWSCLSGLIRKRLVAKRRPPGNFQEWIQQHFGRGIADLFLLPYNRKVWAYPPAELGWHWINDRVSPVDMGRVIHNLLLQKADVSWGPNNTFRFPLRGGTGAIWHAVAKLVGIDSIHLETRVMRIEAATNTLTLANGERMRYGKLLSTMPLDALCHLLIDMPPALRVRADALKHSACHIVGIGLKGRPRQELATRCWMYFPEDNCPFYRVTVFSNYSPNNTPDAFEYWSLMTETSESAAKPVNRPLLVEDTVAGLLNTGLIMSRDQIVSNWTYFAPYGYPTPTLERDAILRGIQPWLEAHGIYSRGRFGGWRYEVGNQDHSLMQGVEWVNRVVLDIPEQTYAFPATTASDRGR